MAAQFAQLREVEIATAVALDCRDEHAHGRTGLGHAGDGREHIRARTEDRDAPVSEATVAAHLAAAHEWGAPAPDSFDDLKGIAHPALVVNGSNDIVVPTINSYILQQNLPNAELILFPDSNHGSHFQFTERFSRYVTDFVER